MPVFAAKISDRLLLAFIVIYMVSSKDCRVSREFSP